MNDMRKLINLMEGIESVPGLGQSIEEIESDMQTAATADNDEVTGGFDVDRPMATESEMDTPDYEKFQARFSELMNSYVEPQEAFDIVSREMDEQGVEADEQDLIMAKLEDDFFPADDGEPMGSYDMPDDDYSEPDNIEFEEAFGSPVEEAFDLQNGYDDINDASGNDYFPNGADGPVVRSTGPSGARQGDNPAQKKMQVAEVHKELVYGYRNFLKESAQLDQKKTIKENQSAPDLSLEDWDGDLRVDGKSAKFNGKLLINGRAPAINNQTIEIQFDVIVTAVAEIETVSNDTPTGWDYRTDSPVYSSDSYLEVGDVTIQSISFTNDGIFIVDGEDSNIRDAQKVFHISTLKKLLDPKPYEKFVVKVIENKLEDIDSHDDGY